MVIRIHEKCLINCLKAPAKQLRCLSSKHYNSVNTTKYIGKESSRVKRLKLVTLTSSLVATTFVPVMALKSTTGLTLATSAFLPITYLCTFAVYFVTKSYVTEMYLTSADMLLAKKFNIFCKKVSHKIDPKDIEVPVDLGMFESFRVKNEGYFIDDNEIKDPELFKCISGLRYQEKSKISCDEKK